jgi:shikimate kinase
MHPAVAGLPVFLTGMMGSGKSTVGRMLAEATAATFVDLDHRIECLFGESVAALFAGGEARFRRCETLALQSLVAEPGFTGRPVVVATGGGVVLDLVNRRCMALAGTIAFLDVPVDELVRRLRAEEQRSKRPLVAEAGRGLKGRLAELLAARRHAYLDGSLVVDGTGKPEAVVARLREALEPPGERGSRVG